MGKLNWKAFFFLLTLSAVTVWGGYMLIHVWRPDWFADTPRGRGFERFFWPFAFIMATCTIWSLFVESDKK
jgi:hypothetical protein